MFKNDGPWNSQQIYMVQAGSSAYATRTPESDLDYRGVFLAQPSQIYGLENVEAYTEEAPIDLQCYELRHFVKLCLRGSPLQLEMLFYPEDVEVRCWPDCDHPHWAWDELKAIRKSFLGKHLRKTLGGFAKGDIQRIKGNSTAKSGAKGKLLIAKYGYNTKHAANAYRLLKMAETLFLTGELVVRPDKAIREEIKAVKRGKFSRDEFLKWIEDEDKRIFQLAEGTDLPKNSDYHLAQKTVMSIHKRFITQ
jgi:hypothetical protein